MWYLGVTSTETKQGRFSEGISCGMGRFLSFCFLICIRGMSKIRWKAGSHFIICGSVCCLACHLPPVPRRRLSSPAWSHETGFY